MTMTPEQAQRWIDDYARAWRTKDADAAAALFTDDGIYRSHPLREAHRGREAIRAYWHRATENQRDLDLRFGRPIVGDYRVAVEWWVSGGEEDGDFTLPGCLVLRFAPEGSCEELREYWHVEPERLGPPEGWGV